MTRTRQLAPQAVQIAPGSREHRTLLAELAGEPLASQWWEDAESRVDTDSARISYMVVYVNGPYGLPVPAAWAGWRIDTNDQGTRELRCCDNYVRRGFRGRSPELYRIAYTARHRQVVLKLRLPAVTYLFPEPVSVHMASGWGADDAPDASGTSTPHAGGPVHHWRRLTWTPRS